MFFSDFWWFSFGVFLKNINSGALGKGITRQVLPRRINAGITYMPIAGLSTSIVSEHLLGRDDLQIKGAMRYNVNSFLEICFRKYFLWVTTRASIPNCIKIIAAKYCASFNEAREDANRNPCLFHIRFRSASDVWQCIEHKSARSAPVVDEIAHF